MIMMGHTSVKSTFCLFLVVFFIFDHYIQSTEATASQASPSTSATLTPTWVCPHPDNATVILDIPYPSPGHGLTSAWLYVFHSMGLLTRNEILSLFPLTPNLDTPHQQQQHGNGAPIMTTFASILAPDTVFLPMVTHGALTGKGDDAQLHNPYCCDHPEENAWGYLFQPLCPLPSSQILATLPRVQFTPQVLGDIHIKSPWSVKAYYYPMSPAPNGNRDKYSETFYHTHRQEGHQSVSNYMHIHPTIQQEIDTEWQHLGLADKHVLGIHIRGTDKSLNKKIPLSEYLPYIFSWLYLEDNISNIEDTRQQKLQVKQRLVYVSTDDSAVLYTLLTLMKMLGLEHHIRYRNIDRRLWSQPSDLSTGPPKTTASTSFTSTPTLTPMAEKSHAILMDIQLLSKCDFLIVSASGVSEFAFYFNPSLHTQSVHLQYAHGRMTPPWLRTKTVLQDLWMYYKPLNSSHATDLERHVQCLHQHTLAAILGEPPVNIRLYSSSQSCGGDSVLHAKRYLPPPMMLASVVGSGQSVRTVERDVLHQVCDMKATFQVLKTKTSNTIPLSSQHTENHKGGTSRFSNNPRLEESLDSFDPRRDMDRHFNKLHGPFGRRRHMHGGSSGEEDNDKEDNDGIHGPTPTRVMYQAAFTILGQAAEGIWMPQGLRALSSPESTWNQQWQGKHNCTWTGCYFRTPAETCQALHRKYKDSLLEMEKKEERTERGATSRGSGTKNSSGISERFHEKELFSLTDAPSPSHHVYRPNAPTTPQDMGHIQALLNFYRNAAVLATLVFRPTPFLQDLLDQRLEEAHIPRAMSHSDPFSFSQADVVTTSSSVDKERGQQHPSSGVSSSNSDSNTNTNNEAIHSEDASINISPGDTSGYTVRTLGLHIRRGDACQNRPAECLPVTTYLQAAEDVRTIYPTANTLYIATDDPTVIEEIRHVVQGTWEIKSQVFDRLAVGGDPKEHAKHSTRTSAGKWPYWIENRVKNGLADAHEVQLSAFVDLEMLARSDVLIGMQSTAFMSTAFLLHYGRGGIVPPYVLLDRYSHGICMQGSVCSKPRPRPPP